MTIILIACSTNKHTTEWLEKKGYIGIDYSNYGYDRGKLNIQTVPHIPRTLMKMYKRQKKAGVIEIIDPTLDIATSQWILKQYEIPIEEWREKQKSYTLDSLHYMHTLDSLECLYTSEEQKGTGLNENVLRTLIDSSMLQLLFMDEIQVKEWQEKGKQRLYTLDSLAYLNALDSMKIH